MTRRMHLIGIPSLAAALLLVAAVALIAAGGIAQDTETPPVAVFASLDGTWEGFFVGFDPKGGEIYRIAVRQIYQTRDATTQTVTVRDTFPDGRVVTGQGVNTARRRPDGSLELCCKVTKSNGERVIHSGRRARGADGDEALIWWSAGPDRSETFLETVRLEGDRQVYAIDGMGRYGESLILMQGRYHRVE